MPKEIEMIAVDPLTYPINRFAQEIKDAVVDWKELRANSLFLDVVLKELGLPDKKDEIGADLRTLAKRLNLDEDYLQNKIIFTLDAIATTFSSPK